MSFSHEFNQLKDILKNFIPKKPKPEANIILADIIWQLPRDAHLEKPYRYGWQAMKKAIEQCNVPPDMAQELAKVSRVNLHLLRMLRRSEAERAFSLAYLRHSYDIFSENKELAEIVISVINSEDVDTKMFWTFAPYLFKALKEKGIEERDAISKILFWSKDGVSAETVSYDKSNGVRRLNLKGLEKYESEAADGWVLSKDPNNVSHKYTEQEARRIADLLIAERGTFSENLE